MTGLKLAVTWLRWLIAGELVIELLLLASAAFGSVFQKQLAANMDNSSFRWDNLGPDGLFFAGLLSAGLALSLLVLIALSGTGWAVAAASAHPFRAFFPRTTLWSLGGLALLIPGVLLSLSLLKGGMLPH